MARDFSGTAQYLTFSDVAGMDLPNPTVNWTVAALVYMDAIVSGYYILGHGDLGAANCGWRFGMSNDKIIAAANGQWGVAGTATTALTAGVWYGVAAQKPSAGTLITYKRYTLSTSSFVSETVETSANGYTDGASPGRIGGLVTDGVTGFLWDGRMKRVAYWNGATLSEGELEQFFHGLSVVNPGGSLKSWWELDGIVDPEIDHGSNLVNAANVSTTFVADPAESGSPFTSSIAGIGRRMQGWQQVLA